MKQDAFLELNQLIGLTNVKRQVNEMVSRMHVDRERKLKGLKVKTSSNHLVFTGNPGTGKTTVARIIAKIMKELGVISKGQLVEVQRSDLVGEYIGQTATKTKSVINKAMDGILFIDEAYTLATGAGKNDFGSEAIAELLTAMENYSERLVVIVAGYTKEMQKFIDTNPGLASRFKTTIHFEDYSGEQMFEIFKNLCNENDYNITAEASPALLEHLIQLYKGRDAHFGNARDVRNLFDLTLNNQALRLYKKKEKLHKRALMEITFNDLPFTENIEEETNENVEIPLIETSDPTPQFDMPPLWVNQFTVKDTSVFDNNVLFHKYSPEVQHVFKDYDDIADYSLGSTLKQLRFIHKNRHRFPPGVADELAEERMNWIKGKTYELIQNIPH